MIALYEEQVEIKVQFKPWQSWSPFTVIVWKQAAWTFCYL